MSEQRLGRLLRLVRRGIDRIEEELTEHLWTHYAACSDCNNVRYFEGVDFPEAFSITPCPSCGVFNQLLPIDQEDEEQEEEPNDSEHKEDAIAYLSDLLLGKQVPTILADGTVTWRNQTNSEHVGDALRYGTSPVGEEFFAKWRQAMEKEEEKVPEDIQGLAEYLKKRFHDEIDMAVERLYMASDRPEQHEAIEDRLKAIVADLYQVEFGEELSTFHSLRVYANVKRVTDMLRMFLDQYAHYVFNECREAENGRD